MTMIADSLTAFGSLAAALLAVLLIPVNWGIESYKWQLITAPVQRISYRTATKSVYSGICLGNLAPGRATEFLAKIIYFDAPNRPKVAVLHFLSGLFQLSVTVLAGFAGMFVHARHLVNSGGWVLYVASSLGIFFILALCVAVYKIDPVLNYLSRRFSKDHATEKFHYSLGRHLIVQMLVYSIIRYAVFYAQFALLLHIFVPFGLSIGIFAGIALYFLVTSFIPMISVFEAVIRAAVALLIFQDSGIDDAALALSSVLLWLVNIIVPSVIGYYFLWRQNFNFKVFRARR